MTKQEFIHTYGKSVYQVRLETAMSYFVSRDNTPGQCLHHADRFVAMLLEEEVAGIKFKGLDETASA